MLFRKSVYPYEFMDDWEKFNGKSLPEKEEFHSNLYMKNITDSDYSHAKRICKDFEIKKLGEYHKSDTWIGDVCENFKKMYLEIYELDPAKFLSAPGLAWHAALKKTKVKLELLTEIDMLLMVEKGIREGLCHSINSYMQKLIINIWKIMIKKESSYLKYWNVNN